MLTALIESISDVTWQTAFNGILTILLAVVGYFMNWVRKQVTEEFQRIDSRIDELKADHERSSRDARIDRTSCQAGLPEKFIPRREHETFVKSIDTSLAEIKAELRQLREVFVNSNKH